MTTYPAEPESIVRPYVRGLAPTPDIGTYPREFRALSSHRTPLVVLIVWGADTTRAMVALHRGGSYARGFDYRVHESLTCYGGPIRDAPLVGLALKHFERREVDYERAWWLVRHSAISSREMENARTALRQTWNQGAAATGEFLRRTRTGPESLSPTRDRLPGAPYAARNE